MSFIDSSPTRLFGRRPLRWLVSAFLAGAPTHWIGVIVRDVKDDRAMQDLDIALTAKKDGLVRTAKLMPMPGSYGANISLPETGRYTVTVAITRDGQPVEMAFPFQYE